MPESWLASRPEGPGMPVVTRQRRSWPKGSLPLRRARRRYEDVSSCLRLPAIDASILRLKRGISSGGWTWCILNHMVQHTTASLDASFAALSDATRRGVLEQLGRADASITDLADKFHM